MGRPVEAVQGVQGEDDPLQRGCGGEAPRQHRPGPRPGGPRGDGHDRHGRRSRRRGVVDELAESGRGDQETERSDDLGLPRGAVQAGRARGPRRRARGPRPAPGRWTTGHRTSPSCRPPTRSSTSSPSDTRLSASPATRRRRRSRTTATTPAAAVSATRTVVRPPTPSHDQATARKVIAATSRHRATEPQQDRGHRGGADAAPWVRRPGRCGGEGRQGSGTACRHRLARAGARRYGGEESSDEPVRPW